MGQANAAFTRNARRGSHGPDRDRLEQQERNLNRLEYMHAQKLYEADKRNADKAERALERKQEMNLQARLNREQKEAASGGAQDKRNQVLMLQEMELRDK